MTAEVCVMNKNGVALAADSAVTLMGRHQKIYNSAEKLFLLSEADPVGVLIWDGASLIDVPWETIVKMYRRERGQVHRASIEAHAADFVEWLGNHPHLIRPDDEDSWVLRFTYDAIHYFIREFRALVRDVADDATKSGGLTQAQAKRLVNKQLQALVSDMTAFVRTLDRMEGMPRGSMGRLRKAYTKQVEEIIDRLLPKAQLTATSRKALVTHVFQRMQHTAGPSSGLAFAGFGAEEVYPALISYTIGGHVFGNLRYSKSRPERVGADFDAIVKPFAQSEMVQAFHHGIDPGLERFLQTFIDRTYSDLPETVVKKLPKLPAAQVATVRKAISKLSSDLVAQLFAEWESFQQKNHVEPILDIVMNLPKDELAQMAEALVNLTSFKRRVTTAAETVGGPIDVAVITRGEGFVWIRRKHYFDPGLNPRFIAQHYKWAKQ